MEIERLCADEICPLLSLTVMLKLKGVPAEELGVPLITPMDEFKLRPGGRDPDATVQLM